MHFHIALTGSVLELILHLGGLNGQCGTQEKNTWGAR